METGKKGVGEQGLKKHEGQHCPWQSMGASAQMSKSGKRTLLGDQKLHYRTYILFIRYLIYQIYVTIYLNSLGAWF